MSSSLHAWYDLSDLGALADRKAEISGQIELGSVTRLRGLLRSDRGSVTATLRFRQRRAGYVIVDLECEASLELQCQRCLEPLHHEVSGRARLALLETAVMEEHVPEECEPVLLEDGRVTLAGLIEDELIVGLPLVAKHRELAECGALAKRLESHGRQQDTSPLSPPRYGNN